MSMITILPDDSGSSSSGFLAFLGKTQSVGRTVGEALDALNAQLDASQRGSLILVQQFEPDQYFSAQQRDRLQQLMELWRVARDNDSALSDDEQTELEALVDLELKAAAARAEILNRSDSP